MCLHQLQGLRRIRPLNNFSKLIIMKTNNVIHSEINKGTVLTLPPFISSFFLLISIFSMVFLSGSCRPDDEPPPPPQDPCENSTSNEWFIRINSPESDLYDLTIFPSGVPIEFEVEFISREGFECNYIHRIEIQLIQPHFISLGNFEERLVHTLADEVVRTSESFVFEEAYIPPDAGNYVIRVVAYDENDEEVHSRESAFHVQQMISAEFPVEINIGGPHNGQKIQRGSPLNAQYYFDSKGHFNVSATVEIWDEYNNVVRVIEELNSLSDSNSGIAPLATNIRGKYKILARTWYKYPTGTSIVVNMAVNSYEII